MSRPKFVPLLVAFLVLAAISTAVAQPKPSVSRDPSPTPTTSASDPGAPESQASPSSTLGPDEIAQVEAPAVGQCVPPFNVTLAPAEMDWPRPDYSVMGNSHQLFQSTGDYHTKLKDWDIWEFDNYPETFAKPKAITVFTTGVSTDVAALVSCKVPTPTVYHGYQVAPDEAQSLSASGRTSGASDIDPRIDVWVTSKSAIRQIISLPFVYMVHLPAEPYLAQVTATGPPSTSDVSSLSWIQQQQKVTWLWGHRNNDDGETRNGEMPPSTTFAIIDSGYDPARSLFGSPYAKSRITLCYDAATGTSAVPTEGQPWPSACGTADISWHGTAVADVLDATNKHSGNYIIVSLATALANPASYNINTAIYNAYRFIQGDHREVDVISSSAGIPSYFAGAEGATRSCRSNFDNTLQDLTTSYAMKISGPEGNPMPVGGPQVYVYPADTVFASAAGGAYDGNPWTTPDRAVSGNVYINARDSYGRLYCSLQYDHNQGAWNSDYVFKPDVYGFFEVRTDKPNSQQSGDYKAVGTSFAQPQIASGLGTMSNRPRGDPGWAHWNDRPTYLCWEGAVTLLWASAAPDGRDVLPSWKSYYGDLADHDAWYLDVSYC